MVVVVVVVVVVGGSWEIERGAYYYKISDDRFSVNFLCFHSLHFTSCFFLFDYTKGIVRLDNFEIEIASIK